jgi:hypothetical protein
MNSPQRETLGAFLKPEMVVIADRLLALAKFPLREPALLSCLGELNGLRSPLFASALELLG